MLGACERAFFVHCILYRVKMKTEGNVIFAPVGRMQLAANTSTFIYAYSDLGLLEVKSKDCFIMHMSTQFVDHGAFN